jgi:hypothetical protein
MQNHHISARDLKDNISIIDLFTKLGYRPDYKVSNEYYFKSLLRDEHHASMAVNDRKGAWYDFGGVNGGNIIDFGKLYWPGTTFPEVLEKIVNVCGLPSGSAAMQRERRPEIKVPHYGVLAIKELTNSTVINYIAGRGVALVAKGRLKEVHYYIENDNKQRMTYVAPGWQNETGAWEVRTPQHPLCLGPKAISFIPNSEKRLAVFEGYFDYLSWLADNPFATESALVLNSVSLLQAGIAKAKPFNDIYLFFDHDNAGRYATAEFIKALPRAQDCSGIYLGYNDYNDKLVAERQAYNYNQAR